MKNASESIQRTEVIRRTFNEEGFRNLLAMDDDEIITGVRREGPDSTIVVRSVRYVVQKP